MDGGPERGTPGYPPDSPTGFRSRSAWAERSARIASQVAAHATERATPAASTFLEAHQSAALRAFVAS